MLNRSTALLTVFLYILSGNVSAGLPIEWGGTLGFDWVRINNARRTGSESIGYTDNSMIPDGASETAKFQSYIFRLDPKIIVNDSATIKGELSIGNNRGGLLGDSGSANASFSQNGFFHYARPSSSSQVSANQIYIELFSEAAIYKIGRFSRGWGLGALFDDGSDMWDRFITTQDGIEVNYRFGNLSLSPIFTKISSEKYNSQAEVRELGVTLGYDNDNTGFSSGVYYGSRNAGAANNYYTAYLPGSGTGAAATYDLNQVGSVKLTVVDVFVEKKWEKFRIGFEAPIMNGDIDNPYGQATASRSSYKASAYILEADYQMSPSIKIGINAGSVSGASGTSLSEFGAMSLNPNYQIAHLMFRYNMNAIDNVLGNKAATDLTHSADLFESSIKNATFAKVFMEYKTEKWLWKSALVFAKANEVATNGSFFYNHEKGHRSSAVAGGDQKDDMGYELDLGFDYNWNPNILLGGFFGYHFVGDYYGFDNTANSNPKNSYIIGLNLGLQF